MRINRYHKKLSDIANFLTLHFNFPLTIPWNNLCTLIAVNSIVKDYFLLLDLQDDNTKSLPLNLVKLGVSVTKMRWMQRLTVKKSGTHGC